MQLIEKIYQTRLGREMADNSFNNKYFGVQNKEASIAFTSSIGVLNCIHFLHQERCVSVLCDIIPVGTFNTVLVAKATTFFL